MNAPKVTMLGAFSVYAFVYPFAILLLSFDWMPFGMEWMSSLLLATLGVTAGAWLWMNFGTKGLLVSGAILLAGLGLEYVGVTTGFPFGSYSYTGVLVPELAGGVPLAIGFAWLLVVMGGIFTAGRVLRTGSVWRACLLAAVLAVGLDLLLEPVAYHVKGYWQWHDAGGYYGVPWTNFIAWLVAAMLMNLAVSRVLNLQKYRSEGANGMGVLSARPYRARPYNRARPYIWNWVPIALYVMNVVMFGIVNVTHGFWWSGLVGLVLLGGLWLLRGVPSTPPSRSATTPSS